MDQYHHLTDDELLGRAFDAGLLVAALDRVLTVTGPPCAEPIALELLRRKDRLVRRLNTTPETLAPERRAWWRCRTDELVRDGLHREHAEHRALVEAIEPAAPEPARRAQR